MVITKKLWLKNTILNSIIQYNLIWFLLPVLQTNKKALSRLDVIKKYTVKCDNEHLEELKDNLDNDSTGSINSSHPNYKKIEDCEQFIILVGNKVKELIYNEKDNVIKKKNNKNNNKLL